MSMLRVVTYDISDDNIRSKVSGILENYGFRVQYSVFECHLESEEFDQLRVEITGLVEEQDSIRWYSLCSWCADKITRQGKGELTGDGDYFMV
jgi:CRISPR-associated protein Cas2